MAAAAGPITVMVLYPWPPPPIPPAPPVIPLPSDVFLQELGHANKSDLDYGAEDVAWYNLGLAGIRLDSEAQFLHYARALVQRVREPFGTRGVQATREQARRRRVSIVLMALRTTLGYQRPSMNQLYPADDFPSPNDLSDFPDFTARWRRLTFHPPLNPATIPALKRLVRLRGPDKDRIRAKYYARRQELYPGHIEMAMSRLRQFATEAETANRFGGFTVDDPGQGGYQALNCTHAAYRGEGNSLWHVLAAQLLPPNADGKVNLRAGRRYKALLFNIMVWVLCLPTSPRHRMYCQMQAISPDEIRQRYNAATVRQMWEDWGEMSLLRCLATNEPDAGPPKYPQFKGIFQLISDAWRVEVLVWVGNLGTWGRNGGHYDLHVFGPQSYGLFGKYPSNDPFWNAGFSPISGFQQGGQGQLVFVTDPSWTHYDLPANVAFPFDTSHKTNADRFGWLGLPFLNANGPMELDARVVPPGPYRTYAEHLDAIHLPEQMDSFLADFNVRDDDHPVVAIKVSKMPVMPDAATRAGWTQEINLNQTHLPVEPWSMTSGCYRDPNRGPGDNSVKWGRFENKSAYEVNRLKAHLALRNLPWEPRSTTTVDDEVHLR